MKKWLGLSAAWVMSDVTTMLQLSWMKQMWPSAYDFSIGVFSPISMGLHNLVVAAWAEASELAGALLVNTS
jgi:hypothetical protein